jgi:hypothetical protein
VPFIEEPMMPVTRRNSSQGQYTRKRVASLKPSPENRVLYRHPAEDPDIDALAESIKRRGCEPLTITADNFIVSGHRRQAALILNGQKFVLCKVLACRRDAMTTDEYVALLRDYNQQRNKTTAEQVREEIVDIDPDGARDRLHDARLRSVYAPEVNGVEGIRIEGSKKRCELSDDKADHVKYILQVVEERRKYWPLSVRGVHYPLLNFKFIRGIYWPHRDKPGYGQPQTLWYANDSGSYKATADIITRLRLDGTIPWKAFDDFTRPVKEYHPFRDVREYVRHEVDNLLAGYWRDLLQSQPDHIEVVCEKNTIYHMVLTVTEKYQIDTSSGRGFNSIDPWHDVHERYKASGKNRLIIITLTDQDPEGQQIPHVAGRTLRDDFGVPEHKIVIIPAAVTREQTRGLPEQNFAKEESSNYDWYVERNGGQTAVWELEALDPAAMLRDLDELIRRVINVDLFNAELEREREEQDYVDDARERVLDALGDLDDLGE